MPTPDVVNAMVNLLTTAFVKRDGTGDLKYVSPIYYRLTPRSDTPRAVVWPLGPIRESREFGGAANSLTGQPIGTKIRVYKVDTHLTWFAKDENDQAAWFALVGAVEDLYRRRPNLRLVADTDNSKIMQFGETMETTYAPPLIGSTNLLLEAHVTVTVEEAFNA